MAGAVHVKREIGAFFNHVVQGAHHLGIEQAQIQHALGQYLHRGVVRVGETGTGAGGVDGGHLRGQHQFVQVTLRPREAAIGGEGAGDVGGVSIELATRVNQHQLAVADCARIRAVMQHTGVSARGNDGAIRRALRAMAAELMQ